MTRITLPTTLAILFTPILACNLEADDGTDESLRSIVVTDSWGLHEPAHFPDVNSCDDYWNDRCVNLTPLQCTVAQDRYSCESTSQGVIITDSFAKVAKALDWTKVGVGDEGGNQGEDPLALCETKNDVEQAECLQLAGVAATVAASSPALMAEFPEGGFASLTIRDDILMVEPLIVNKTDLVYSAAGALDWEVPMIAGELAIAEAGGIVIEDDIMLSVRPNGSISVSTSDAAFMQRPGQSK
ncbi:hypothetical protein ACNOYE_25640 [Nannocystaceae bacterium ST9]